jgi:hypothetical protein
MLFVGAIRGSKAQRQGGRMSRSTVRARNAIVAEVIE